MNMKAMQLRKPASSLILTEVPVPVPDIEQILIKVYACGVCRTDLHIADGELTEPKLPLIPGHQIVGVVESAGRNVKRFKKGEMIGVPWLGYTCGKCKYCLSGKENLCVNAEFTGYNIDGGFAEYTVAHQQYCFKIPEEYGDINAAPLLCAGFIGYRSYKMINDKFENLGIYGFGAAAHIITQVAVWQNKKVFAFVKKGDEKAKEFADNLECYWSGYSEESPPEILDAAIIFAPVGSLIPMALRATDKGGTVVCGGIHMSDIPSFEYKYLWGERKIISVANLTRIDGEELLEIAPKIPIRTEVNIYSLEETNKALSDLRTGNITGAAVIKIN